MREEVGGYVYILAGGRNGTLYTGSARNLISRVSQHREGLGCTFTRKYGATRLVWFETHDSIAAAYQREQLIKRWRRDWKIALIEKQNPHWSDLFAPLLQPALPGRRPRESGAESRDPG